jgi:hypothetical protein
LALGARAQAMQAVPDLEPHGFIEPCTVANHQQMDTQCELCAVSPAEPQPCLERLGSRGFEKKCRTRGDARGFAEVWCTAPRATESEGARAGGEAGRGATAFWLFGSATLVAGFLFFRQRWLRTRRDASQGVGH